MLEKITIALLLTIPLTGIANAAHFNTSVQDTIPLYFNLQQVTSSFVPILERSTDTASGITVIIPQEIGSITYKLNSGACELVTAVLVIDNPRLAGQQFRQLDQEAQQSWREEWLNAFRNGFREGTYIKCQSCMNQSVMVLEYLYGDGK